jgi:orotidine-5'-phosphate decarboxylase
MGTLDDLRKQRAERAELDAKIADIDARTRQSVAAAFDEGIHWEDIAAATGFSKARVYQVRKGTRR